MQDMLAENLKTRRKYSVEFAQVFNTPLAAYWSNLTRFDIVKFDKEFLETPDGVSAQDFVREHYGDRGVTLIKALL